MTETLSYIHQSLDLLYFKNEVDSMIRLLLKAVCDISPHHLLLDKDRKLSDAEREKVRRVVDRLKQAEPIQYVLGEADFYDLVFRVTPDVLIPRSETEELVERIIQDYRHKAVRLLDIGTGSGCIAVSLAYHLQNASVSALDISEGALNVARHNAKANNVSIEFFHADILNVSDILGGNCWEVIVSNPPYVMEKEKAEMERNVLMYEPPGALFVPDDDPLLFYRVIARFGREKLVPDGSLYLEINAQCGQETVDLLCGESYRNVELIKDIFGRDRFVKACL